MRRIGEDGSMDNAFSTIGDEERVERIRDILVHARNRWHYY
jgi:hypothetical protein